MNIDIEKEVIQRNITRICHFTPSRNLIHILTGNAGILATKNLKSDERNVFNQTDLERLDQHDDYISCSIQYPNAWYFSKVINDEKIFKDWVVLLVDPKYLWQSGSRFCPRNAASNRGGNVREGFDGFSALFVNSITGAYGRRYTRTQMQKPCCPTDQQAEVLIPDRIDLMDILAVAVRSEEQAKNELARLKYVDLPREVPDFVVAPKFYDKRALDNAIKTGVPVEEAIYTKIRL